MCTRDSNGSGKHNNWSLGTDTGVNLFGPGKTASENLQFIAFLVNAISAVYKFNGLLKASIMSATNAHRLGANEAPPAIISTSVSYTHLDVYKRQVRAQAMAESMAQQFSVQAIQQMAKIQDLRGKYF